MFRVCSGCGGASIGKTCHWCKSEESGGISHPGRRATLASIRSLNEQALGVFLTALIGICVPGVGILGVIRGVRLNGELVQAGGVPNLMATVSIAIGMVNSLFWVIFLILSRQYLI